MEVREVLRKVRDYSLVIAVLVGIFLVFSFYNSTNKDIVPYNDYPEGSILVAKNSYVYPYKTIIAIYKDGEVKKSKIVDEVTDMGAPREKYNKIRTLSHDEVKQLEKLISDCESHRIEKAESQDYGLLIKVSHQSVLESCSNFEQEYVNKLNEFVESAGAD